MADKKAHETRLATRASDRSETRVSAQVERWFKQSEDKMRALAAKHIDPERMMQIVMFAVNGNSKLLQCTLPSIVASLITATKMGLEIGNELGEAYLIPRKIKGQMICQCQTGYRGKLKLVYNSGFFSKVQANTVYPEDAFEFEEGSTPFLRHRRSISATRGAPNQAPLAHYAIAVPFNGVSSFFVMSDADAIRHRDRFVSHWASTPWAEDHDAMSCKTCIHQLAKNLPQEIEVRDAKTGASYNLKRMLMAEDQAAVSEIASARNLDENETISIMPDAEIEDREPGAEG